MTACWLAPSQLWGFSRSFTWRSKLWAALQAFPQILRAGNAHYILFRVSRLERLPFLHDSILTDLFCLKRRSLWWQSKHGAGEESCPRNPVQQPLPAETSILPSWKVGGRPWIYETDVLWNLEHQETSTSPCLKHYPTDRRDLQEGRARRTLGGWRRLEIAQLAWGIATALPPPPPSPSKNRCNTRRLPSRGWS